MRIAFGNETLAKNGIMGDMKYGFYRFAGSPYHAKAHEIESRRHKQRAALMALPMMKFGDKDPNTRRRMKIVEDLRQCDSEWLQMESEYLSWKAKEIRRDDKTQKSIGFSIAVEGEIVHKADERVGKKFGNWAGQAAAPTAPPGGVGGAAPGMKTAAAAVGGGSMKSKGDDDAEKFIGAVLSPLLFGGGDSDEEEKAIKTPVRRASNDSCLEPHAKKSFYGDLEPKLTPFRGTPFYARALTCLSEGLACQADLDVYSSSKERTNKPSGGYNSMGLNFDNVEHDKKWDELWRKQREADNKFTRLKAEFLKWAASNMTKQQTKKALNDLDGLIDKSSAHGIGSTTIREGPFEEETSSRRILTDYSHPYTILDNSMKDLERIINRG